MGSGTDIFLDRPEQKDEQGLREAMCERRSVCICCHDSPHDEAIDPRLRPFHTVSERKFSETCTAVVRGLPDSGIPEMLNQPYRRGGKEHYIPAVATNYLDHRQYVAVTGHVGSGNDFARFPLSTTAYRTVKADPPRVQPLF